MAKHKKNSVFIAGEKECANCIRKELNFDCNICENGNCWADAKTYRQEVISKMQLHVTSESKEIQRLYTDVINSIKLIDATI